MRILVACESSGLIRDAFRAKGHDAVSCDLLPTEKPGPHIQGDALQAVKEDWDMLIAHPPCTYLTNSAAWAYGDGPYHQKVKPGTLVGEERRLERLKAIEFAEELWSSDIPRICIENPIGALSTHSCAGKPTQFIQPYEYGDDASKRTCLWLKGLPQLVPTTYCEPRLVQQGGKTFKRWANQTDSGQNRLGPSDDRWKMRSKTYKGWAEAMAEQWG